MKRISALLTVYDNNVVITKGFNIKSIVGSIKYSLENLCKWEIDDVIILDIKSDFINENLLKQVSKCKVNTPLIYGGSLKEPEDFDKVASYGFERFALCSSLLGEREILEKVTNKYGKQSLIGVIPFRFLDQNIVINCDKKDILDKNDLEMFLDNINNFCSEALYLNVSQEGFENVNTIKDFQIAELDVKIDSIYCGGFSLHSFDLINEALSNKKVMSIAFTNIFHYKEIPTFYIKENNIFENLRRVVF